MRELLAHSDTYQWEVGEKILEGMEELSPYWQEHNGRARLIEQLSNKTGTDKSTLRDRHNVVAFWKPKMTDDYRIFSWSQLRAIKFAGDKWKQYANWALKDYPYTPPPDVIRARIKGNGDEIPVWMYRWNKLGDAIEKLVTAKDIPDEVRKWGNDFSVLWNTTDKQIKEKPGI